ncbi:hypothetical protein NUU61_006291 [Penicillium alfredii]|uniref:Uncharacterized protein n=1 Tax=Penicillium alfredii TaxID=1506179 RepID=A0A9W9F0S8_9EURO|nr:uncharacterized protein NUU61_006291 [Penicillium alfredii]KAJ5091421.1 hypothetical protein NUU61_006291 [Penicillium alfredii]
MASIPLPGGDLSDPKPAAFNMDHPLLLSSNALQKRYHTVSIPASYGRLNSSPPAGTVVGIVLGSVAGFVLLLYLIFLTLNPGGRARGGGISSDSIDEEEVVEVRSRRSRPSGPRRRSDNIVEVMEERERRRPAPSRRERDRDRVVVEEDSVTGTTTTDDRGDVVEVIEEESSAPSSASPLPPRRMRSGRGGPAYRTVDPYDYGGGSEYGSRYR